jgi:hypothetical protein
MAASLFPAAPDRGATTDRRSGDASGGQFRPKLSGVSVSRAVRVNGCCERSIARDPRTRIPSAKVQACRVKTICAEQTWLTTTAHVFKSVVSVQAISIR